MRFQFKTDYEDDIRLFPHSGYVLSYGTLLTLLVIAPFVLSGYLVSQLVFVCIYATVGVALLILTGFTGQASLGHAAFLAIGAYTAAYLRSARSSDFRRCGCRASISSSPPFPLPSSSKRFLRDGKA